MKKNLLLRLCLILLVALTAYSCRTDHLNENESKYNNSSKFLLTSKRISLDEAKHKAQLIPEINKAEAKFREISKTNVNGKIIDYGNGVSIDTDEVIYIENGPNYFTYTFRVVRENAPAEAPVENLVLSPLSDGTFRELLVSYNLTAGEKQILMNGGFVNLKGKMETHEFSGGVYSGQIFSKTTTTQCHWETYTYTTPCACHPGHYDATECTCPKGKPVQYVLTWNVCEDVEDTAPSAGLPGNGASSGGGGTETPTQPCDGNGIPTQPQDPNSTLGTNESCNSGIPTQPNLPLPTIDPCRKTKASITAANDVLSSTAGQSMDTFLRGKVNADKEWNVGLEQTPAGIKTTPPKEGTKTTSTPDLSTLTGTYIGNGHSHAGEGGQPSGMDMYAIWDRFQIFPNHKYTYVYGSYFGNEEMYALVIDNPSLLADFFAKFPRSENVDEQNHSIKDNSPLGLEFYKAQNHASEGRIDNASGEYYEPRAVAMAYILEKYNSGISIAKADANGKLRKLNANVQQITVSGSGAVKEGVKVSQCP